MRVSLSTACFFGGVLASVAAFALACGGSEECRDCGETPLPPRDLDAGTDATTNDARVEEDAGPPSGTCLWSKAFGGPDSQFGSAVTVDPQGNIFVGSSTRGTIDFGGGLLTADESDIAFARFDGTGKHLYSVLYGGTGNQFVTGMASNGGGNIYAAGQMRGTLSFGDAGTVTANADGAFDSYMVRFRPDNTISSVDHITGPGEQAAFGLAADPSSGAAVIGRNAGQLQAVAQTVDKAGSIDSFVVRLQATSINWARGIPGTANGEAHGVTYEPDGRILVSGFFSGQITIAGKTFTSAGNSDAFVARFDANGNAVDAMSFGGAADDQAWVIVSDTANGNILVGGEFAASFSVAGKTLTSKGGRDIFVVRLDKSLSPIDVKSYGGVADERAMVLTTNPDGSFIVGGVTAGDVDFGGGNLASGGGLDAYLVKIDGKGQHVWSKRFGGPGDQTLYWNGLARAPNGDLIVFAAFQQEVDVGCGKLTAVDGFDVWLGRFAERY